MAQHKEEVAVINILSLPTHGMMSRKLLTQVRSSALMQSDMQGPTLLMYPLIPRSVYKAKRTTTASAAFGASLTAAAGASAACGGDDDSSDSGDDLYREDCHVQSSGDIDVLDGTDGQATRGIERSHSTFEVGL